MNYIKIIALVAIAFVCSLGLNAQTAKQDTVVKKVKSFTFDGVKNISQDYRFGIHISPTIASLAFDEGKYSSEGSITKFSIGIILDKYIGGTDRYAFSTGLNITNKGGYFKSFEDTLTFDNLVIAGGENGTKVKLNLRYWEIPLNLRLRTDPIQEKFIGYAQVGWINGFRTKARADLPGESGANFRKDTRFFNFSLNFGAGLEYKFGENSTAMIGLVFNRGLNGVMRDIKKVHANSVALQIGIFY